MIKRLRLKFVCINMAIVTLMLCVMFGLTLNMTKVHLEQEGLRTLREMHMPEKDKKGEKPEENTDKRPVDKKEERPDDKHGARLPTFTLRYEQGALLVSGSDAFDLTDTAYLQSVLDAAIATGAESGELEAHSLRFLRLNDVQGGYIFADISSERTTMQNLLRDSMIIGIIAFVSFLGISIFLSFWAIKPVERAWTQQRQFVGDASHELKTPLTVIMTNAEMLRDASVEGEKREQCAENIHRMSLQMRSLIEELLTLARAEDVQRVNMQSVELSEILDDAVLQFEPLFYERGLALQTEIAENLRVHGDATLIGRLVEVLLDNAQKYSLPGEVRLSLKKHGGHAHLRICNPAEAISEEELAHLFERFYRVDKARSTTGSYGLGLSIADGITRRHGGSIRAEYADGRLAFYVKLPIK